MIKRKEFTFFIKFVRVGVERYQIIKSGGNKMKKQITLFLLISTLVSAKEGDTKTQKMDLNQKSEKINKIEKHQGAQFKGGIGAGIGYGSPLYKAAETKPGPLLTGSIGYGNLYLEGTELGYEKQLTSQLTITPFIEFMGGINGGNYEGYQIKGKDLKEGYKGIDDRKAQLEGGVSVTYSTNRKINMTGRIHGGKQGGTLELGVSQFHRVFERLFFIPYLKGTVINANMVRYYFGVDEKEVNRSATDKLDKTYDPNKLGYTMSLGISYIYAFNQNWQLFGVIEEKYLSKEIHNSPIVENKWNYGIVAGLKYTF